MPATHAGKVRATLRLPRILYDEARGFVERRASPARNINDFFVAAVGAYVKLLKRKQIDAAFQGMSADAEYQKEAQLIAEQFSAADWQAFQTAERESVEA